jgi:hypothetical protein
MSSLTAVAYFREDHFSGGRPICADEDTTCWPEEDIGNLRVALNTLVRVFRFVE